MNSTSIICNDRAILTHVGWVVVVFVLIMATNIVEIFPDVSLWVWKQAHISDNLLKFYLFKVGPYLAFLWLMLCFFLLK